MTAQQALNLKEGAYIRFIQDVEINGYKWLYTDLLQIEFVEIQAGGHVEWWIRNLTWAKDNRKPNVQKFGMYWMLNYGHRVEEINNMNTTVIHHKFNVGDRVWIMHNNKPYDQKVTDMEVSWHKDVSKSLEEQEIKPCIRYHLYGDLCDSWFYENQLFATKDELLDSLR